MTTITELPADNWFVVRTQPYRERWAAENIARQGCLYYLPEILEHIWVVARGVRSRVHRVRPLFPCYLFVKTEGQWHFLLNTFGVTAIVTGSNGSPGTISGQLIDGLRKREESGVVVLPPRNKFVPEQSVRLMKGAFSGHVGIVQGNSASERVRVLLDLLGRKTSVLVAENALEAA